MITDLSGVFQINKFEIAGLAWTVKTQKFELRFFRNTHLFEINMGHTGFRDLDLFMIYLLIIVYNNICFGCATERLIETFLLCAQNL